MSYNCIELVQRGPLVQATPEKRCVKFSKSYLVDVLALELADESVQTVIVSLDANGLKDLLDIGGGRGGVASKAEEQVSCEMLHFDIKF